MKDPKDKLDEPFSDDGWTNDDDLFYKDREDNYTSYTEDQESELDGDRSHLPHPNFGM